jgi:protein-L-isoaspartate O-methyltransferase
VTPGERRRHAQDAYLGFAARGGAPRVMKARASLARVLWTPHGQRKLPGKAALDRALSALPAEELAWLCEFAPLGPLYFLPTRRFVNALAAKLRELGVRRVLEVAAGDGFLAQSLSASAPDLEVIASDSGAWETPRARMTKLEAKNHARTHVPGLLLGGHVHRLDAQKAVHKFAPDTVIACWLPPGAELLDGLIRSKVRYVLEIGAGSGVTASAYSWRFAHEFLEGPLERLARCRLDTRPERETHSRITLYYGRGHADHVEERVHPGEFLWQFRPQKRAARRRGDR